MQPARTDRRPFPADHYLQPLIRQSSPTHVSVHHRPSFVNRRDAGSESDDEQRSIVAPVVSMRSMNKVSLHRQGKSTLGPGPSDHEGSVTANAERWFDDTNENVSYAAQNGSFFNGTTVGPVLRMTS